MSRAWFRAPSGSGDPCGFLVGAGEPVVVAHGGSGLGYEYLFTLVEELAKEFRVACFQQRGLSPSATTGEFTIAEAVAEAFFEQMLWRVGEGKRARVEELDAKDMDGTATPEEQQEEWDLIWPGYLADRGNVMPRPPMPLSMDAHRGLWDDLKAQLPELEAGLERIPVPVGVLVGGASPMPPELAGGATAARVPGAWLEVVEGAGHFPWWERPGCVNEALRRLVSAT